MKKLLFSKDKQLRSMPYEDQGQAKYVSVKVKHKKVEKAKYKKKAWAEFSKFIRMSHIEYQDYVRCYTCGTLKPWKQMQAGHGIGGRSNAVLFDIRIVKPQCSGCNLFGGGQYRIFTRKLIDELGLKEYDKVVHNSTTLMPLKEFQFEEIYRKYKDLVQELTKVDPRDPNGIDIDSHID